MVHWVSEGLEEAGRVPEGDLDRPGHDGEEGEGCEGGRGTSLHGEVLFEALTVSVVRLFALSALARLTLQLGQGSSEAL